MLALEFESYMPPGEVAQQRGRFASDFEGCFQVRRQP
jgi:hypothetical protein